MKQVLPQNLPKQQVQDKFTTSQRQLPQRTLTSDDWLTSCDDDGHDDCDGDDDAGHGDCGGEGGR